LKDFYKIVDFDSILVTNSNLMKSHEISSQVPLGGFFLSKIKKHQLLLAELLN